MASILRLVLAQLCIKSATHMSKGAAAADRAVRAIPKVAPAMGPTPPNGLSRSASSASLHAHANVNFCTYVTCIFSRLLGHSGLCIMIRWASCQVARSVRSATKLQQCMLSQPVRLMSSGAASTGKSSDILDSLMGGASADKAQVREIKPLFFTVVLARTRTSACRAGSLTLYSPSRARVRTRSSG